MTSQNQLELVEIRQTVLTPHGEIPITGIQIGDEVIGLDYETKQQEVYTVTQKGPFGRSRSKITPDGVFKYDSHKSKQFVEVNNRFYFAPHQSIYANGVVVHAFELKQGDVIEDMYGNRMQIYALRRVRSDSLKISLTIEKKRNIVQKILRKRTKQSHTYYINGILVHNASRYWVGGTATWDGTAGSKWAATSGGAGGSSIPTAADDVFFDASSGAVTVTTSGTTTDVCRSLDCNGFTGTISHASGTTIRIGDATAGAGNRALRFSAGMTYTLGNTSTSAINFISTSSTAQDVDFAGKTTANVTYDGSGGSWKLTGTHNQTVNDVNAIVTVTRGTLDFNGQTVSYSRFASSNSNTRALILGSSGITLTRVTGAAIWDTTTVTGLTVTPGTSTITLVGANANFISGTATFNNIVFTGASQPVISANITCNNLTRTGTASVSDSFSLQGNITVTGTFTSTGNSLVNRMLVLSNSMGTARTITAANVSLTNTDFRDITGAGAATWTGTSLGDSLGNSNITFDTPVTRYWVGNGGNMSNTARWSTSSGGASGASVPLCHDTIVFDANSITSASQTITQDIARVKSLDFTNVLNNPTYNMAVGSPWGAIHGDLIFAPGMTHSATGLMTFYNRTPAVIKGTTGAGTLPINIQSTSTITLTADWLCSNGTGNFIVNQGTFDTGNYNMQVNILQATATSTKTVTLGTSTITITSTAAASVFNLSAAALTFSGASSTIVISRVSANTRVFAGAGQTFGTVTYNVAGSTGILQITGNNTINTLNFSDSTNARTLQFAASSTNTIANYNVFGGSGRLVTVNSITSGVQANVKVTTSATVSYVDVKDINSNLSGGIAIDDTVGGVNSGNNDYWIFSGGLINLNDSGAAVDQLTSPQVSFPLTDSGSGTESGPGISVSTDLSDSGSLSDALSIQNSISLSDRGGSRIGSALRFDGDQNYLALGVTNWASQLTVSRGLHIRVKIRGATAPIMILEGDHTTGNSHLKLEAFHNGTQNVIAFEVVSHSGSVRNYMQLKDVLDGAPHIIDCYLNPVSNVMFTLVDDDGSGGVNGANSLIGQTIDFDDFRCGVDIAESGNYNSFDIDYLMLGFLDNWPAYTKRAEFLINTGTGTTITDNTGNGNTATFTGDPLPEWVGGFEVDEVLSVIASLSLSDSGAGIDAVSIAAMMILADVGTAEDAVEILAMLDLQETVLGTEVLEILRSISVSETGSGQESINIDQTFLLEDAGVGTDEIFKKILEFPRTMRVKLIAKIIRAKLTAQSIVARLR